MLHSGKVAVNKIGWAMISALRCKTLWMANKHGIATTGTRTSNIMPPNESLLTMKKALIFSLIILLGACSSTPQHADLPASSSDDQVNELVMYAVSLADTPYHYGGNSPDNGFDCSGFVVHVFRHSMGVKLPRTSHELSRVGTFVSIKKLRPGDLLFYNTQHSSYSHVGIYIGDNKFVHAPKSGSHIRVEKMNEKYWLSRYNGARRISE